MTRIRIGVSLFAALLTAPAWGLEEMSATSEGRGQVALGGRTVSVDRCEISLIPGGNFVLSLHGEERYAFRGQWRQERGRVLLDIAESPEGPASGTGEIRLSGDRFRQVRIDGENRAFSASFQTGGRYTDFTASGAASRPDDIAAPVVPARPAAPIQPAGEAPVVTVGGTGRFERSGHAAEIVDAMEVFLHPDGRLELKTFGPGGQRSLAGRWRAADNAPRGRRRFDLEIQSGFGPGRTTGEGYVLVAGGNRIERLAVRGNAAALFADFSIEFRQR